MSLYQVQKILYELNRDPKTQDRYHENFEGFISEFELTQEERTALIEGDIGLLYIMGVNGQILMHFSALIGQEWSQYIQAMKDALEVYGQVRAGIYSAVDGGEGGAI